MIENNSNRQSRARRAALTARLAAPPTKDEVRPDPVARYLAAQAELTAARLEFLRTHNGTIPPELQVPEPEPEEPAAARWRRALFPGADAEPDA